MTTGGVTEEGFEQLIESSLVGSDRMTTGPAPTVAAEDGSSSYSAAGGHSGGYKSIHYSAYDRELCLIPDEVVGFIQATQPKSWDRIKNVHGDAARSRLLTRLSREIEKRGLLHVLRRGVREAGTQIRLCYFKPSSGLNKDLQLLYQANRFELVRQLHYSTKDAGNSIDLGLFLNGLPVFTAELKSPLNGQDVTNAISQYRNDRDPKEPSLKQGRCLAHFAVDPNLAYVASALQGPTTTFLPFNRGDGTGAGNPPSKTKLPTSYLWEEVWAPDSVLDLVQHFAHEYDEEDENGKKTGRRVQIFPRYHQLDCVRRLVEHARAHGTNQKYLIQHSAGSGKSNSIAWLAHQLSVLHDDSDRRVFDSIIVITDRRVLDRQLQRTIRSFEQTAGVVENISQTSRQLKDALEAGKTIIVTTLQKFPVIASEMEKLSGQRFAVIVDEAHSSQSGESTQKLHQVLEAASLESAEAAEGAEVETDEDLVVRVAASRKMPPNVSMFAFTATPKPRTLELFGAKQPDGRFRPFSLYSMRQAIEERFILDVLQNYTTYKTYWNLLKKAEDDPQYDRQKASYLLRSFVDLHEHAISQKILLMLDHFIENVQHRIAGRAKAMIVTRSRLHAVRYKLALDKELAKRGLNTKMKALVAFSGTVKDPATGAEFTESGMNGFPETQTAATFNQPDYRFMVVAEKFQTGFDQPLLHTMYVDKKLSGVNAVQTLSRLNRVHPDKEETTVLDFSNEAEDIKSAFEPYYETTILSEATEPAILYDLQHELEEFGIFSDSDVLAYSEAYFDPDPDQAKLYGILRPLEQRFGELSDEEQADFRSKLVQFIRQYAFLGQIMPFEDAELERLFALAKHLRRVLPTPDNSLPLEVQQQVDMATYRVQQTSKGAISLARGEGEIEPISEKGRMVSGQEDIEPLSLIIADLNSKFGTDFSEEDRVFVEELLERLGQDETLATSLKVNAPENARLTFNHVVSDKLQDMVETNFKFYKKVNDDKDFGEFFLGWLFDMLRKQGA